MNDGVKESVSCTILHFNLQYDIPVKVQYVLGQRKTLKIYMSLFTVTGSLLQSGYSSQRMPPSGLIALIEV